MRTGINFKLSTRKALLTGLFIVLAFSAAARDSKNLLEKIRANYESLASFETGLAYEIYRGFESTLPVEEYSGYFCRNGENSYRKIDRSEYINVPSEKVFLLINHIDRSMMVSAPVAEELLNADLEKSLAVCRNIIATPVGTETIFSLYLREKNDLPFSRIDVRVNSDYWITEMTFYYVSEVNFSKDFNHPDYDEVKMRIAYKDFVPKWDDANHILDLKKYIAAGETALAPADLYKSYSIVDLRKK